MELVRQTGLGANLAVQVTSALLLEQRSILVPVSALLGFIAQEEIPFRTIRFSAALPATTAQLVPHSPFPAPVDHTNLSQGHRSARTAPSIISARVDLLIRRFASRAMSALPVLPTPQFARTERTLALQQPR